MERAPRTIIDIKPKTIIKASLVILLLFCVWQIRDILLLIAVALLISIFVEAATRKLEKIRIPRIAGVVTVYILGFGIIAGLLYFIVPIFLEELLSIGSLFPDNSTISGLTSFFQNFSQIKSTIGSSGQNPVEVVNAIRSSFTAQGVFSSLSAVFGGIINLLVLIIISFYFSIQRHSVDHFFVLLSPRKYEERVAGIWRRSKERIMGWFRGQLLSATILAVATYIGLLIMGIPYALLLSLTALVFSLIPYGIVLATVPAGLVAFLGGGLPLALLVLGYYFLLQQLENYVLQPLIMHSVTGVPSLVVLLSAIIGVTLIGFFGLILALPFCIILIECLDDHERNEFLLLDKEEAFPGAK